MSASSLISRLNGQTVTLKRVSSTVSYVNGIAQASVRVDSSIKMSVQPLTGDELRNTPGGQKERNTMRGYTTTLLYGSEEEDSTEADIIEWNGKQFQVQVVEPWIQGNGNIGTFYKIYMFEVDP